MTDETNSSPAERERKMRYAVETRNLEIDLYWRRTAYFWTLLAAAFAGYVALENDLAPSVVGAAETLNISRFILACIGLVFSIAWYMVNRGSKYWQKTWERHVDLIKDDPVGEMFRSRLEPADFNIRALLQAFPFSVSKINQALSLYVSVVWIFLATRSFPFIGWTAKMEHTGVIAFISVTVVFIVYMWCNARTDQEASAIQVSMITRQVKKKSRQ